MWSFEAPALEAGGLLEVSEKVDRFGAISGVFLSAILGVKNLGDFFLHQFFFFF